MGNSKEFRPWEKISRKQIAQTLEILSAFSAHPRWSPDKAGETMAVFQEFLETAPSSGRGWSLIPPFLRRDKGLFETTHPLRGEFSLPSGSHWQIRHPLRSEVTEIRQPDKGWSGTYGEHDHLSDEDGKSVGILVKKYQDSIGRMRVLFDVGEAYRRIDTYGKEYLGFRSIQKYLSAPLGDPEVYGDIVIYKNISRGTRMEMRVAPASDSNKIALVRVDLVWAGS